MKGSAITAATMIVLAVTPGMAQDRSTVFGLYSTEGMGCDAGMAGKPGGPVSIEATALMIAGIECRLSSQTNVARMNAVLVDASCKFSGQNKKDRMFIQRNREGVTIVAEGLGTFILDQCPDF
ncbi:hypothetical protein [Pseudosulfitobacter pseudonitzschiae]|uniref:hypothetical protein n=1 Tax=Pseudosulfitobacter pseudonitzschiae TaxID=1402135 RepID=UPI003B77E22D